MDKDFEFTVLAVGRGANAEEAWDDAKEAFERKIEDDAYDRAMEITGLPQGREHRIAIDDALDWDVQHGACETLRQALVDEAEQALGVTQVEGQCVVSVDGTDFVVTFQPAGETA